MSEEDNVDGKKGKQTFYVVRVVRDIYFVTNFVVNVRVLKTLGIFKVTLLGVNIH